MHSACGVPWVVCQTLGYSRDTFHRENRRHEEAGIEGLRAIIRQSLCRVRSIAERAAMVGLAARLRGRHRKPISAQQVQSAQQQVYVQQD